METEGISKMGGILDVALELGIVSKSGSFFNYEGKPLAQGREGAKVYLVEHTRFAEELDKKIRDLAASGKKLPKEIGEEKEE